MDLPNSWGGPHTGSGFDYGKYKMAYKMGRFAHHELSYESWGNTEPQRQCDGDESAGNGQGVLITVKRQPAKTKWTELRGPTSVRLNGAFFPEGEAVEWWFGYGTKSLEEEEYAHSTAVGTSESASGEIDVSRAISGLIPNTTYHVTLFARYPDGEVEVGEEIEFTVQPPEEDASPGPRVTRDRNGTMHLFYRQSDGNLGHQWLAANSETWSGEVRPVNSMAGDPRVSVDGTGVLHVFYRQTDGNLGHQWIPDGSESWSGEVRPVNSMVGDPSVVVDANRTLHVFYRQTDGNMGHQWLASGSESWGGEVRPVSSMAGDPRVIVDANKTLHVFYRQTDGNMGHQWIPNGSESWGGEVRPVSSMAGDPRVIVDANKTLHVFYRQTDGNMGHQWIPHGSEAWSGEVRPVSSMASDPRLLVDDNAVLHVFYGQTDGNMGHQWIPNGSESWSGEVRPVSAIGSGPKPIIDASKTLHVFYRQTDGNMGHQWVPSGSESWSGEVRPVSSMASGPHPFVDATKVLHAFYGETSKNIGHQWIPSGSESWSGEVRPTLLAARPPQVSTGSVQLDGDRATVKGTVSPEGSLTNYYFEYGPTTAYGSKQPIAGGSAGDASGSFAVSEVLSNLSPSTTYHYRLVASNGEGTSKGADATFATAGFPAVTTKPATGVTGTEAILPASVNPKGLATTYRFEYGKTTAYGSTTPTLNAGSGTTALAVSQQIANLAFETLYHYRVVATNSQGTARGKDMTFTTTTIGPKLSGLAVTEPFDASSASLTRFTNEWSPLGWASGSAPKGENTATGWRPVDSYPTLNGAYYSTSLADSGTGIAVAAKLAARPGLAGRHFSLWLDMATPAGAKAGYELRFTETAANVYEVKLSKWQAGVETVLASTQGFSFAVGGQIGLTDKGSSVIGWTDAGSGFSQLLAAEDSSFASGRAGISGAGNNTRLANFKAGVLLPSQQSGPEGRWFLRNANTTGVADVEFIYGGADLLPVAGDWNNDGIDTPGAYKPSTGQWFLRNSNTGGAGEISFTFGGCCDLLPVAGDWNNDGIDTIGLYKPSEGRWFLRNSNSGGVGEIEFNWGWGAEPIAGDWNNDGKDTIGLFLRSSGSDGWYLSNTNSSAGGIIDIQFTFGSGFELAPVVGDWNNDGIDTPGLYKQSLGQWFLRNSNTTGAANLEFTYGGGSGSRPVAGDWNKDGTDTIGTVR